MTNDPLLNPAVERFQQIIADAEKQKAVLDKTIADAKSGIRLLMGGSAPEYYDSGDMDTQKKAEQQQDVVPNGYVPVTSRILELARKNPTQIFTVKEIMAAFGPEVPPKTISGALWRLTNGSQELENPSRGKYRLAARR